MRFKPAGLLTKLVVLALLIYMTTSLLDLREKIQGVQAQRDELAQQVASQKLENERLEEAIENSEDPEMLEQVARDRGLVKANEELYVNVAN